MKKWFQAVLVFCLSVCSYGQIITPLYIGNVKPAMDQRGKPFAGTFTYPQAASLVEIRSTDSDLAYPPSTNGLSSPMNPLVTNGIGYMGLNAVGTNSGFFCKVYPFRLPQGTKIFARVFNAPSATSATFYADSKVVAVPPSYESSLSLEFLDARPLNANDSDNDGLNDSWESYFGIDDRQTPDYDMDGSSDLNEMLAGTSPDDPSSIFKIKGVVETAGSVKIYWYSVPDKTYQVQCTHDLLLPFTNVGERTTATAYESVETVASSNRSKHFRVVIP